MCARACARVHACVCVLLLLFLAVYRRSPETSVPFCAAFARLQRRVELQRAEDDREAGGNAGAGSVLSTRTKTPTQHRQHDNHIPNRGFTFTGSCNRSFQNYNSVKC